jgi:hypothetical protein
MRPGGFRWAAIKLHFEPDLDCQRDAIEAVCDLFRCPGARHCRPAAGEGSGQRSGAGRGLRHDVYDPTTGQIRSAATDDIACWFIDTDYNGESFFVRHAYFTGAASKEDGGPYDKLKRALRAEIDEAAWSSLYRTVSQPFDKPESGKIAVKVINHYGDEVLKVFEI